MSLLLSALFAVFTLFSSSVLAEENPVWSVNCQIPNQNTNGTCTHREKCPVYEALFNSSQLTTERLSFLKRVQCTFLDDVKICCPNNGEYKKPEIVSNPKLKKVRKPLSKDVISVRVGEDDEDYCGQQAFVSKVRGGEITEIDEFPWMALLLYESLITHELEHGCGGALINKRFVLTAAHCVAGKEYQQKGPLKSVRLGEYNIQMNPDCIQESDGFDCSDDPVNCEPQQIIVHPGYNSESTNKRNDIALLKLNRDISYSDFIQPICLPLSGYNDGLNNGKILFVAGWGRTDLFRIKRGDILSPIKLKLKLPYVDRNFCSKVFKPQKLSIGAGQICAGGEKARDTCPGDSGSPLMFYDLSNARWVVSGIVSLGVRDCGTEGIPGVYTNVREYITWIQDNSKV